MQDWHYRNPYNRKTDKKNRNRWNIGEEDGSRGLSPRGKSVAYKDGYNAGAYHRLMEQAFGTSEHVLEEGHSR